MTDTQEVVEQAARAVDVTARELLNSEGFREGVLQLIESEIAFKITPGAWAKAAVGAAAIAAASSILTRRGIAGSVKAAEARAEEARAEAEKAQEESKKAKEEARRSTEGYSELLDKIEARGAATEAEFAAMMSRIRENSEVVDLVREMTDAFRERKAKEKAEKDKPKKTVGKPRWGLSTTKKKAKDLPWSRLPLSWGEDGALSEDELGEILGVVTPRVDTGEHEEDRKLLLEAGKALGFID